MNNDRNHQRFPAFRRLCLGAALIASAASVHAHPGHGLLDEGPLHTVTSPYHLAVLALSGAALFAGAHVTKRVVPRRALQSFGVIAVVVSAVLWGLRI